MENQYQTQPTEIIEIFNEAPNVKRFKLKSDSNKLDFGPGQIIEISMPGFGEAPVAICSDPRENRWIEVCVRKVGALTTKIHTLKIGDKINIRGPYGNTWPTKILESTDNAKKNLLIVVGGIGLIPLRPLFLSKEKYLPTTKIQLFYGAKTPEDFIFKQELKEWQSIGIDVQLSIDKPSADWKGKVGLVTTLFESTKVIDNAIAFLCGPPIMYKFALEKMRKFEDENIYLSLEKRMHCGIGVCQHCAVGPYYVCTNGPVFSYDKIKNIKNAL